MAHNNDPSVDEQVVAGADDCHAFDYPTPISIITTLVNLYFGYQYIAGVRFQGVAVPNGATIIAANLSFNARFTDAGAIDDLYIYGEDADDASGYSTVGDFNGRARTTERVPWAPGAWTSGVWYDTPDIKDVVKEIIDRGGWASGQDMAFFVQHEGSTTNDRRPQSFEGAAGGAAKLHIEYSVAPPAAEAYGLVV